MSTAALLTWAKARAVPVASCVTARLRTDHLTGDASREQMVALVEVLAAAADPARLHAVVSAPAEPLTLERRRAMLRKAHSEAKTLRKYGREIPAWLAALDREYERDKRRRSRTRTGERSMPARRAA